MRRVAAPVLTVALAISTSTSATDKATASPKNADHIVIVRSTRTLTLLNHGQVLKTYKVALGGDPLGLKVKAGDKKTPEGDYVIDSKNTKSRFYLRSSHLLPKRC